MRELRMEIQIRLNVKSPMDDSTPLGPLTDEMLSAATAGVVAEIAAAGVGSAEVIGITGEVVDGKVVE